MEFSSASLNIWMGAVRTSDSFCVLCIVGEDKSSALTCRSSPSESLLLFCVQRTAARQAIPVKIEVNANNLAYLKRLVIHSNLLGDVTAILPGDLECIK